MGYNKTPYEVEILARQIVTLRRVSHGALAPIGPANAAGPKPVKARPARGRHKSETGPHALKIVLDQSDGARHNLSIEVSILRFTLLAAAAACRALLLVPIDKAIFNSVL
jgi:hypothetical protein